MQASVNVNKKENLKLNLSKKLYIIGAMIAVFSALFLTIGVSFEHF